METGVKKQTLVTIRSEGDSCMVDTQQVRVRKQLVDEISWKAENVDATVTFQNGYSPFTWITINIPMGTTSGPHSPRADAAVDSYRYDVTCGGGTTYNPPDVIVDP